jgi:phosphoribosylformylglycinamidine cyclo-ligase
MFGTFNMGVGMVIVVDAEHAEKVLHLLDDAYEISEKSQKEQRKSI